MVQPQDDLPALIATALTDNEIAPQVGDILVVTSKIVSKAEGRIVALSSVSPSAQAHHYAEITGKDPRIVELVLQESVKVSKAVRNTLIVEHRLGFVCANAGVDQSNLEDGDARALLLPLDPDTSAARIHAALSARFGVSIAVLISDSQGRPFRLGNVGVAIGAAGLPTLIDKRGEQDLYGRTLQITLQAFGDLVASAAQLISGEGNEGLPLVLVRGVRFTAQDGKAADLIRPSTQDLYR